MNIQEFHDLIFNVQPIDLLQFTEVVPELQLLKDTNQSPPHHEEGNVLMHTQMTIDIVLQLMEVEKIENKEDQVVLYLATLLHDIAKPATYGISKKHGRITSYGHDDVGVPLANEFLKKYFPEIPYKGRERILRLIEWHMKPRMWMKDGTTVNKMKMLSLATNTKLLYLLSQADTLGRTAKDMTPTMMLLEEFKQNCEDLGIWDRPYRVPLAVHLDDASYSLARWNILINDAPESAETYDAARELMGQPIPHFQLMLMVGAPGSGKDYYTKQLVSQYPNVKVICMDERRKELTGNINDQSRNNKVFGWQEKELRKAMKEKKTTIINATNPTRKLRRTLWRIGREYGALCSAVYFDLKLETLLERNSNREKRVPDDVVKRFYNAQQSICPWEADLIRVISDEDNIF